MQSQWLYLSPWHGSATGNLGLSYSLNQQSGNEQNQAGSLIGELHSNINSRGFIYRPWVLSSAFGFKTDLNHNLYNISNQQQQSLVSGSANGNFVIYPQSNSPTTISLQQRLELQLGDDTNRRHRTRIGLSNNYQPHESDFSLINNLQWNTEQELLNNRSYSSLSLYSSFQQTISDSSSYTLTLSGDSRLVTSDIPLADIDNESTKVNTQDRDENNNLGLNYSQLWQFSDLGSSSLRVSYLIEDSQQLLSSHRLKQAQLSNLSFLRSEQDPRLSYSLSLLLNDFSTETHTKSDNETQPSDAQTNQSQSANTSIGFNFEYSELLRFQGAASINQQMQPQLQTTSYNQSLGAQYSDNTQLSADTRYGWGGNLNIAATQASGDSDASGQLSLSPNISHNINTLFEFFEQKINVSLSQGLSSQYSDKKSVPEAQWLLNQYGSFSWSSDDNGQHSNILLALSDYRHLNDQPAEEQSVYITFQRNTQLDADSDWGGNLTYEWRRTIDDDLHQELTRSAAGSLWYREIEIFDVTGLNYQSTLELPINDLLFDNKDSNNKVTNWQNRLDFRMGLLEATAQMDMTLDSYHLSLSVKRYFGMAF